MLPISEAADAEDHVDDSDVSKAKEGDLHLPNCAAHPDQVVTQYYTPCDDVICRKCTVTSPPHADGEKGDWSWSGTERLHKLQNTISLSEGSLTHQRQLLSLRDGLDGLRSLAVDRG